MKKKLLSGFLTLSLIVSITACGSTTPKTNTESSAATSTKEALSSTDVSETETHNDSATTIASTAFGKVQGIETENVLTWYGIPYAAAPVGDLRWEAPQDPTVWKQTLDCTKPGKTEIQSSTDLTTGKVSIIGDEDCLNLDVYAKKGSTNLPVLVYVHGGNNQTGSSAEIPGTDLVMKDNCVYVSVNYRLGMLGFNCLPAFQTTENSTGNYAMQDLAKSLDWIKQNIKSFGGNPDNITISGFSAGGRDVMAMLISPLFKDKFNRAVVYSGGMTLSDEDASASVIASAVAPLAVADGKAQDDAKAKEWLLSSDPSVVTYLKSVSADRLVSLMTNASIRMSVFPHLYKDGVVIPKEGFDTTQYNDVPVLMLTGATEFSFFSAFDPYFKSDEMMAVDETTRNAAKTFAINYGSDMYRIFNAQSSAEKMIPNYKSNIYLCQINYGSKDSLTKVDTIGSFHGIFVPMLVSNNNYKAYVDNTQAGYASMANTFNNYLAQFIATGDPNKNGETEWTNWNVDHKVSMVFDADTTTSTNELKDVSSSYDQVIAAMQADKTIDKKIKLDVISNVMNGRWFSAALDQYYGNPSLWK